MPVSTALSVTQNLPGNLTLARESEGARFEPVEKHPGTTRPVDPDLAEMPLTDPVPQKRFEPPIATSWEPIGPDSTPLQIWEGSVIEVDPDADVMQVVLSAKIGRIRRHTGEIGLEWVTDQDQDLVRPGAVFYLTLFKRSKRGSIENSQELRFRRRPAWSATQLEQIDEEAATLLSKMKPLPTSE